MSTPLAPEQRKTIQTRHLSWMQELGELNMRAARIAGHRIERDHAEDLRAEQAEQAEPDQPHPAEPAPAEAAPSQATPPHPRRAASALRPNRGDPHLQLARTTRAVERIVAMEDRIARGDPAAAPLIPPYDPRRVKLRRVLIKHAECDGTAQGRTAIRRQIDRAIDAALAKDTAGELKLHEIADPIADELNIKLDLAKVPDEFLDMPPRTYDPPPGYPHPVWRLPDH